MRSEVLLRAAALVVFASLITISLSDQYIEEGDRFRKDRDVEDNEENYADGLLRPISQKRGPRIYAPVRSCIKRGGSCDDQRENCCYNSTCRCNFFGFNCRCQRMGIFQKLGK